MRKFSHHIILALSFIGFLLSACSTVKHLPEEEVLYLGTRSLKYYKTPHEAGHKQLSKSLDKNVTVIRTLWEKPNGALLGMPFIRFVPFRLYFYNWFYAEKDSTFSSWMMDNFGEPPISIGDVNPEMRVRLIENELFNQGYFGVKGDYELKYKRNKKQNKAWIRYSFFIPEAYTYREVRVNLPNGAQNLLPSFESYMKGSLIEPGDNFNLDVIANEKQQLWEFLQNEGFYHLRKDHLLILADTTVGTRQVDLEYHIEDKTPDFVFRKVMISDTEIQLDSAFKVKKILLNKAIPIVPDSIYSLDNTRNTLRNLSSLGIFKNPMISYELEPVDSSLMKTRISLGKPDLFSLGASSNVKVKNTGTIGPNLGLFATQKNLFGGAEILRISVDGYMDFPYGVLSERIGRSSGFSATAALSTPLLRSPLPIGKNSDGIPQRNIRLSVELNSRKDFFKIIEWKSSYGISWHKGRRINHTLNLINLNYAYLIDSTRQFQQIIQESPLIEHSYRSQFIMGPSYTFTYNNTLDQIKRLRTFYRTDIETAGNLLNGLHQLSGNKNTEMKFLGVSISQYFRVYSDFRVYYQLGKPTTQLVYRNTIGWGHAYGNSISVPYTRQFFIGGSNTLRPITARVVGPGRYLEFDETAYNQVGDIKLENNLELRFKIWYILHGALWSDLGNIWLLEEDPERPGSGIRMGNILKDSYLTTGIGLRLDLDFLVLRADYGAILYLPSLPEGYKWLWQNKAPFYGLVFGVGYPF